MKGLFITFEGGDGSGKSTQNAMLSEYLKTNYPNANVLHTREPGGTAVSEKIRGLLLDNTLDINPVTECLLYMAARNQLITTVIKPAIENGWIVVCDRYVDSSFVYQGLGRGLGVDFVNNIFVSALGNYLPDITFWIDLAPEEAFKRKGGIDSNDRLEMSGLDFHNKVYEGFKKIHASFGERIQRVDGKLSKQEMFETIKNRVDNLLQSKLF